MIIINVLTSVIYIDFSRAFDSISITKLIHKLSLYCFSGPNLDWLSIFLNKRHIAVKISSSLSQETDQISGIPQGSSIGPLCSLIYINDLPLNIKYCTIKLFADDVNLYFDFICNDFFYFHKLQFDLNALANWANKWSLNISIP